MVLGHFGVAFGAKRLAPRVSLGTLFLACQLADLLWPIFLLAGLERVDIVPGLMEASPLEFVDYPFTHSLLVSLGWGVLAGGIYWLVRRHRAGAWVVGAVVVSHWVLDVPVHGPDLPLWPGSDIRVGIGLWESWTATLVIEFGLLGLGLYLYLGWTRAMDRIGRWGLWGLVAALVAFYLAAVFGPLPASTEALAWSALLLWIFVPLGYWLDRHRAAVEPWVAPAEPE